MCEHTHIYQGPDQVKIAVTCMVYACESGDPYTFWQAQSQLRKPVISI